MSARSGKRKSKKSARSGKGTKLSKIEYGLNPYNTYRSRASGQKAFIKSVDKDHVFFQMEPSGSYGNMSAAEFRKLYEES